MVRGHELGLLLEDLRGNIASPSCQPRTKSMTTTLPWLGNCATPGLRCRRGGASRSPPVEGSEREAGDIARAQATPNSHRRQSSSPGDRVARSLTASGEEPVEPGWEDWLKWRAQGARALALAVRNDHHASIDSFQAAYATFPVGAEATTGEMLRLVSGLVGAGTPPADLLAVLSSDTGKAADLRPLLVAIHKRAGNPVRAPREVEEVAADVGQRFDDAVERMRGITEKDLLLIRAIESLEGTQ